VKYTLVVAGTYTMQVLLFSDGEWLDAFDSQT
jgi:hypothetical protein